MCAGESEAGDVGSSGSGGGSPLVCLQIRVEEGAAASESAQAKAASDMILERLEYVLFSTPCSQNSLSHSHIRSKK